LVEVEEDAVEDAEGVDTAVEEEDEVSLKLHYL
jgi:hypothetical protein